MEKGLVSRKLMATDSTHVKANASRASEYLEEVREEPGANWERLDRYEKEGLAQLERRTGKRPEEANKANQTEQTENTQTSEPHRPEAGHMKCPSNPRG